MQFFLILVALAFVSGACKVGFNLWYMYRNPEWFLFPTITECSLCEKRIYVWQRHERRTWPVEILGDSNGCTATKSSTVHKGCCGVPKTLFTRTVEFH